MSWLCITSLHLYLSKPPDPNGSLLKEMPSSVIREVNKSVVKVTEAQNSEKLCRGRYSRFTSTQAAQVAKFSVQHGNHTAINRYSEEFCVKIKDSTLGT